ncbi:hypothetical protein ACWEP5_14420 [Nocardia niigatensis]
MGDKKIGNRVAERRTGHGTQLGEFLGISATGREVAVPGVAFASATAGSPNSVAPSTVQHAGAAGRATRPAQ